MESGISAKSGTLQLNFNSAPITNFDTFKEFFTLNRNRFLEEKLERDYSCKCLVLIAILYVGTSMDQVFRVYLSNKIADRP